jgi:tetratricopeptide (TPR) repeat protein
MSASRSVEHDVSAVADFDTAVLGGGLPPAAEALIKQAGLIRQQVPEALALLEQACLVAPGHPATLIALYRFHFYGNRLAEAREVAVRALDMALAALSLPARWQDVAADTRFTVLEPLPRFLLFTLKGYAYLSLRLGELDLGRAAIAKLDELDPKDEVGYRVLHAVLARMGRDDIGYEDCPDIAQAAPAMAEAAS